MFMTTQSRRIPRIALWVGLLVLCPYRVGDATDVASPVNVTAGTNPFVQLTQFGNDGNPPSYTWTVEGNNVEFSVRDLTAGQFPMQITAGALSNSIRIGANRNIGFGTSTPQRNLHIASNLTPAIRFDNTDQVWDIEADQFGFTIADINSSIKPLTILPSSGRVGLGTTVPATLLHVHKLAEAGIAEVIARYDITDDTVGRLDINNASSTAATFIPRVQGRSGGLNAALIMEGIITTDSGAGPAIVYNAFKSAGGAVATRPLVVYRNNNVAKMTVGANGDVTATSFSPVSSRSLKHGIVDLDPVKASTALQQLTPVEFIYNDDQVGERRVGFIAEDVPDIVANADRKSVPIMDVVALVTRVVKDQHQDLQAQKQTIREQSQIIAAQQAAIDRHQKSNQEQAASINELMKRLANLESRMQDGK